MTMVFGQWESEQINNVLPREKRPKLQAVFKTSILCKTAYCGSCSMDVSEEEYHKRLFYFWLALGRVFSSELQATTAAIWQHWSVELHLSQL